MAPSSLSSASLNKSPSRNTRSSSRLAAAAAAAKKDRDAIIGAAEAPSTHLVDKVVEKVDSDVAASDSSFSPAAEASLSSSSHHDGISSRRRRGSPMGLSLAEDSTDASNNNGATTRSMVSSASSSSSSSNGPSTTTTTDDSTVNDNNTTTSTTSATSPTPTPNNSSSPTSSPNHLPATRSSSLQSAKRPPKNENTIAQALVDMKRDSRLKNQIVWAKIKGFPEWPARITDVEGDKLKVCFFGEGTFSFILPKNSRAFKVNEAQEKLEKYQKRFENQNSADKKQNYSKLVSGIQTALEELAGNTDVCCMCHTTGFLICCDGCSNASHVSCAGLQAVPDENTFWFCPRCKASGLGQQEMAKRRNDASEALKKSGQPEPVPENLFYTRRDPLTDICDRYYWGMLHTNGSKSKKRKYNDDALWKSFKKRYGKKKSVSKRALRAKRRKVSASPTDEELNSQKAIRITPSNIRSDIQNMQEEQPCYDTTVKHFSQKPFKGQKVVRWYWVSSGAAEKEMHMFFPKFDNPDIQVFNFSSLWKHLLAEDPRVKSELCDLRYYSDALRGWMLVDREWEFDFHRQQILSLRLVRRGDSSEAEYEYIGNQYVNDLLREGTTTTTTTANV